MVSKNAASADNQQGTPIKNWGLLRDYKPNSLAVNCSFRITKAYLLGAIHDGTPGKHALRISQKGILYPQLLCSGIKKLGFKAWVYKEGKTRDVFVVEFSKKVLSGYKLESQKDKIDYIRGYFDAEGSVPRNQKSRFYIYFSQKDFNDLNTLGEFLTNIGVKCGKIHNPSKKIDPDYWRFFVSSKSYKEFSLLVGSYHPIKSKILYKRMKI